MIKANAKSYTQLQFAPSVNTKKQFYKFKVRV